MEQKLKNMISSLTWEEDTYLMLEYIHDTDEYEIALYNYDSHKISPTVFNSSLEAGLEKLFEWANSSRME